jgi:glycosyltransferase involved in cell wall biosynthesis
MRNPAGGSEHRTIALFELLAEAEMVEVWTEEEPHAAFLGMVPMRKVGPPDKFPRGGNLVFVGTYFSIGGWIQASQPKRIVLIHNLDQPERLRQVFGSLASMNLPRPEVVYASESIAAATPDIPGVIHESPIDLNRFSPGQFPGQFVVGRLSRDVLEKHNPGDAAVYERLADNGVKVRIMGGTCLQLSHANIGLLPENAMPAAEFLKGLSCFFYRTHPVWREAYGRVVFEAMACGLPVVGESRHGFSEKLTDGTDALLVDDDEAAFEAVMRIRDDAALRGSLSEKARARVEAIYGVEYRMQMQAFYGR